MNFGMFGAAAVLGFAAVGSALGIARASAGAIGAWKKCFMNNKRAPGALLIFAGAPITQTIYGFILMRQMMNSTVDSWFLLAIGAVCGLGIGASALAQGGTGGAASDALAETGKGFIQYIIVVGLCETVALFVMAFCMLMI